VNIETEKTSEKGKTCGKKNKRAYIYSENLFQTEYISR